MRATLLLLLLICYTVTVLYFSRYSNRAMKSAISALIRRSVRTRNYRLPVLIPSYLLRSSSSNSSTDGGSSSGKSAGKDDSFVSAGNGPNNFPDAVNEVIDEVEVEKDGPKDNNNNNNRNVDFDDQFSDLSEIENILSLPSRSIDPKKKRHAILTEYEFFKYSGQFRRQCIISH